MSENSIDNLKFLSIKGLAKLFGISTANAYSIVAARKIPFYKIGGGSLRFAEKDVLKYLEDRRIESMEFRR